MLEIFAFSIKTFVSLDSFNTYTIKIQGGLLY